MFLKMKIGDKVRIKPNVLEVPNTSYHKYIGKEFTIYHIEIDEYYDDFCYFFDNGYRLTGEYFELINTKDEFNYE